MKYQSEQSFWLLVVVLFLLLAGLNYFPALLGKTPLPRDMVLQFPAWAGLPRTEPWQHYANIGDLVTQIYPFRALAARSISEGPLPLWNPYFLAGAPFAANSQSALFYPPNVLYHVLALPVAWTVCIIVRMFLAAFFMTVLVRSIGGSRAGAVFSGIIFASCGFTTAWQGYPMGDAAVWLPLVCYAVHRLRSRPSSSSLAVAAIAFAMPVLAGHPETAIHIAFAGILMAIFTWVFPLELRARRFDPRFLLNFAVAGLLALGLASIQMIPTLEWVGQIPNALEDRWPALPPHEALGLVSRDIQRAPNSAGLWPPESAAYLGMISLLAAPLVLLHRAKRSAAFLGILTVFGFGVAYSFHAFHWVISQVPVLNAIKNGRMILIGSFGIAGLAGLGISVLEQETSFSTGRRLVALSVIAVAFLLSFLLVYNLQLQTGFKVEFTRRPSFSRALLLASVIPIIWRLYGGLRGLLFPVLTCGIAVFDLATFSYGYTGFTSPNEIFPPSAAFDFLANRDDSDRFRIIEAGSPYGFNAQMMYGRSSSNGYEARVVPRLRAFTSDYIDDRAMGLYLAPASIPALNDRRLDLLNVKYLVVAAGAPEFKLFAGTTRFLQVFNDGNVAIFENKSVLPRAFAVPASGIEIYEDISERLERLRSASFDPELSVILDKLPPSLTIGDHSSSSFESQVELTNSGSNKIAFRAQVSRSAVLVLSQTYYPGWKATVDGQEVPLIAANIALTALPLSAGTHDVRFVFEPVSFKIGAVLTVISTVMIGTLLAFALLSRRKYVYLLKPAAALAGLAAVAGSIVVLSRNSEPDTPSNRSAAIPIEVGDTAVSIRLSGGDSVLAGHARFETDDAARVSGFTLLRYRQADTASDSVVPWTPPITSGLLSLHADDRYRTAIAISNPNNSSADVKFWVRPGTEHGAIDIPANGQISVFLNEPPFDIHTATGTLIFQSTTAVAVSAFLTFQDKDNPFLMAPMPVATSESIHDGPIHIPYIATGPGLSIELILVNPTATPLTGRHRWYRATGELMGNVAYSIPPETTLVYKGARTASSSSLGRIEVAPDRSQPAPAVTAVLFSEQNKQSSLITVSGAEAVLETFLYAEVSNVITTDIAIANPSPKPIVVKLGAEFSIPAGGMVVVPAPVSGIHRVASQSPIAVTILRNVINHGNPRLITSYPVGLQTGSLVPNFAVGGPFATEFILASSGSASASGTLSFFEPGGSPLELFVSRKWRLGTER